MPLRSYCETIVNGRLDFFIENILNIVLFIPIGLLSSFYFKFKVFYKFLLVGISFSHYKNTVYVLRKGPCEVDDLMHNTIGCSVGFLLFKLLAYVRCKFSILIWNWVTNKCVSRMYYTRRSYNMLS